MTAEPLLRLVAAPPQPGDHYPQCNRGCDKQGHYLLSAGAQGEPFSHQDGKTGAPASQNGPTDDR